MRNPKSVELLNRAIAEEELALHQYMYFHFVLNDMGYDVLANIFKRIAIEEMRHVEAFAERVLFLGGDVELGKLPKPVEKIHDPKEMLEWAMKSEAEAIENYSKWAIEVVATDRDLGTEQLFKKVVLDEERHFEIFETEFLNLQKFGNQYLAQQAMERSRRIGGGGSQTSA
ncbi:MAG: bacterioferritin [Aquificae bacterium]|nr:bacterioferritin [Aquificota bacterium]